MPAEPDPPTSAAPNDDRWLEIRSLIERATHLRKDSDGARVDALRLKDQIRATHEHFSSIVGIDRERFSRAALNLLEDAQAARRQQDTEARERQRAEAEARLTGERYRTVFESMTEGFAILEHDDDLRVVEHNPAFARLTMPGRVLGRTIDEVIGHSQAFAKVLSNGEPAQFEVQSGDRWLTVSASKIGGGERDRVALVVTDISRRKAAEEALRASQERLRLIVDNAREYAIFSLDLQRRITSWNSGAQAITGHVADEVLGQVADFIFTPEDRTTGVPEREAFVAITQERATDERWHVRKDGSRFYGSGVMMAMRDATGHAVGLLKIFRDQTAELHAKQALEQSRVRLLEALEETERARADAESANRAKDHFFAVLSHELRTPLTPIMFATELLKLRDDLAQEVQDIVAMVRRNVDLESHLVDDLLEVTRATRGKLELSLAWMDLHAAILQALEVTRPDIEAKRQRLVVALDAKEHEVEGDFARLQQVMWNLVKNASKFTPKGGRIDVVTRNEDDRVIVEVSDNGIGIEAGALASVFEPFTQANAAIARIYGGLGLGLAIAKASVEGHGGELRARSEGRGHGATFIVSLPLKERK